MPTPVPTPIPPFIAWNDVATSVVSAVISALAIGLLTFFGLPTILKRARKEKLLNGVALKRTEGVKIRNDGEDIARRQDHVALPGWLPLASKWEKEAALVVTKFSRVEGERLKTLDRVDPPKIKPLDEEHGRLLRNLDATLKRMDELLGRHSPPQF